MLIALLDCAVTCQEAGIGHGVYGLRPICRTSFRYNSRVRHLPSLSSSFHPLTSYPPTHSSTILTNQLPKRLPTAFISQLAARGVPAGELAYASIPLIAPLPEPLRDQVREAFALSIRTIWISMSAIVCIGLVASFLLRKYELGMAMDEDWGLERKEKGEKGEGEEKREVV
jgi:hypothetical protein